VKSEPAPPMTLSNAAAARMRLIVWCWDCRHQVEPDAAEMAERYGAETTVSDWREVDHTEIGLTLLSVSQDLSACVLLGASS
jgi:hypothetical protein